MVRRRMWFAALGVVGAGSLLYAFTVRGFVAPAAQPGGGLGWLLLGVVPSYAFGMWLLTASSSRVALYVALAATGSAVGSAYETFLWADPEVMEAPGFAYLNAVGLTADAVAAAGFVLMIGAFPDGAIERRWQRRALGSVWASLLVAPLTLLTMPEVVLPQYAGLDAQVANPAFVPALAWAAPAVDRLFVDGSIWGVIGLSVLLTRYVTGDERARSRLRFMTCSVVLVVITWGLYELSPELGIVGTPLGWLVQGGVFVAMLAIPVAGIHGILHYGAFDVAEADRGRLVVRSSSTFITVLYGIGVAAPGLLLFDRLEPVSTVLVTALTAVALLPLRGWLHRAVNRAVLGDRDHHLVLLSGLGARLEQAMEIDEVLARLADGVRRGLDATWVRVRVLPGEGHPAPVPTATAGQVVGPPVARQDLVRGAERLGVLELGPRRRGEYGLPELTLLRTVARQATTTVANVRLTARLNGQLEELTASRIRLITAQDAERRRLERNLHDGIQQSVVALIASLGLARQRLQRGALRPAALVELQDQAREMLTDLRELAHGIHPQVLTDRGLVAAVESRTTGFPVPLAVVADDEARRSRFAPDIEAVAFYTVREALANVAKHSRAGCARVVLSVRSGRLHLEVVDDGEGFVASDAGALHGGLSNIRDRVAAVGGTLTVESTRSGTRLVVDLPAIPDPASSSVPEPADALPGPPEAGVVAVPSQRSADLDPTPWVGTVAPEQDVPRVSTAHG